MPEHLVINSALLISHTTSNPSSNSVGSTFKNISRICPLQPPLLLIGATIISCLDYCNPINWYLSSTQAHHFPSPLDNPLLKTFQLLPISPRQKPSPQGIQQAPGSLSSFLPHFLLLSHSDHIFYHDSSVFPSSEHELLAIPQPLYSGLHTAVIPA